MVSGVRVGGGNQLCLWLIWVKKGHPSQPFSCRLFSTNPMRSQAKEAKINSSNNNSSYCLPCMLLCSHRDSEKLDPNTHQNPYACGNNQDQVFYVQEGRWTRNNLRENRAKDELRDKFCTKKNIFFKKKIQVLPSVFATMPSSVLCLPTHTMAVILKSGIEEIKHSFFNDAIEESHRTPLSFPAELMPFFPRNL